MDNDLPATVAWSRRAFLLGGFGLLTEAVSLLGDGAAGYTTGEMPTVPDTVMVDTEGVLRFQGTGAEAAFFGVNYVAPFAYTYRALGYVAASPEETIRRDVQHFRRMGLNAVRVHVWEVEVSDTAGNVVANEHLRLLDYLIGQCAANGIYVLVTAINWFGNGYPEADQPADGFSAHFPKRDTGTNPAAIAAEARFLAQLADHTNPYTRSAYKDDPAIVGIELLNEPWSPPQAQLSGFFEQLAKAVRDTGCRKPLFYCASQGSYPGLSHAIAESSLDGATFGWYPSGLVSGRTLTGNFLPLLDTYPLMSDPAFDKKAKLIYEFDAADLNCGAMYPAFARTFRTHGAQWATQFAYCPLPLAYGNTPYPTHFVNLLYAPRQAMALVIAGEAFRHLPRGKSYGAYPDNVCFGPFRVRYSPDLCEMVTDEAFLYAGDTQTKPPKPAALKRIAGYGSSPVVQYEGTGCYFLDRVAEGVWQLEVYPDAVWVDDPHGPPRLDREASRLLWREWPMTVRLPDLGEGFMVTGRNAANAFHGSAKGTTFLVHPGVCLLTRRGATAPANLPPAEFAIPPPEMLPPAVVHHPPMEAVEGEPLSVTATVAASADVEVSLLFRSNRDTAPQRFAMRRMRGYTYTAVLPKEKVASGWYAIAVRDRHGERVYPSGLSVAELQNSPTARKAVNVLLDATRIAEPPTVTGEGATAEVVSIRNGPAKVLLLSAMKVTGTEIAADVPLPVTPAAAPTKTDPAVNALLVRARAVGAGTTALHLTFTEANGETCQADVPLSSEWETVRVPLTSLRPGRGWAVLHGPVPGKVKAVRLSLRREGVSNPDAPHGVEVQDIALGALQDWWELRAVSPHAPPVLFEAARDFRPVPGGYLSQAGDGQVRLVPDADGTPALVMAARRSGRSPGLAVRHSLDARWDNRRAAFGRYDAVQIRAHAEASSAAFSLGLLDRDGILWAAPVSLSAGWQIVTLPISAFHPSAGRRVPAGYPGGMGGINEVVPAPHREGVSLSLVNLEGMQFMLTPGGDAGATPAQVQVAHVTLVRSADVSAK